MEFHIDEQIFSLFPGIRFVCVIAQGMNAHPDTDVIHQSLTAAWANAGAAATAYGNPQSHPYIKPWAQRMQSLGAPRKKFPSSIEAMVKRAEKGGEPFHILPAVDFYNAISLANIVPVGGFDIDQMEHGLTLRLSEDGDRFMALDGAEEEPVPAGEVSYADGSKIVTRHFVWKQSRHLLLNETTKDIFFVSEILGELPEDTAEKVSAALVEGLRSCFHIEVSPHILDETHPDLIIKA